MKTLRQILEISQNALSAMKRMADDPRTPVHQRNVAASMYARHNQTNSDLASRTQGWGNSRNQNSSLFDEEGEVKAEHMENHDAILKHHDYTQDETGNYYNKNMTGGVRFWMKNGERNGWEHHYRDSSGKIHKDMGLMADTLHDSIMKSKRL